MHSLDSSVPRAGIPRRNRLLGSTLRPLRTQACSLLHLQLSLVVQVGRGMLLDLN